MGISVYFYFFEPVLDMVESLSSGNVVDEESSNSTAVVRSSNRAEVLLACRVPDL